MVQKVMANTYTLLQINIPFPQDVFWVPLVGTSRVDHKKIEERYGFF
jgi:hypothetical protein